MSRYLKGLLLLLAGFGMSISLVPALLSQIAEQVGLSTVGMGIIFSLQYLAFAAVSASLGGMSRRRTLSEKIPIGALILCAFVLMGMEYSPSVLVLGTGIILIGGCGGAIESVSTMLLSRMERGGSSRLLQLSQFLYCLGAVATPLVASVVLTAPRGSTGFTTGALCLLIAITTALLVGCVRSGVSADSKCSDPEIKTDSSTAETLPHRGVILLSVTMFVYVCAESSLASFIPLFYERSRGFAREISILSLSLFWAGVGLSRLFYAFSERLSGKRTLLYHLLFCVLASFLAAFHPAAIFLLGLGCGPIWPLIAAVTRHEYHRDHLVMQVITAGSLGALCGPLLSSYLFDLFSLQSFTMIASGYFLLAVGTLVFPNRSPS